MRIVRVSLGGNTYLYQTTSALKAGDEVLVETKQGKRQAWGTVVSDSVYVPVLARPILAYVLSTYRKRPLNWALGTRAEIEEAYEAELAEIEELFADMDKSTAEELEKDLEEDGYVSLI